MRGCWRGRLARETGRVPASGSTAVALAPAAAARALMALASARQALWLTTRRSGVRISQGAAFPPSLNHFPAWSIQWVIQGDFCPTARAIAVSEREWSRTWIAVGPVGSSIANGRNQCRIAAVLEVKKEILGQCPAYFQDLRERNPDCPDPHYARTMLPVFRLQSRRSERSTLPVLRVDPLGAGSGSAALRGKANRAPHE